MKRHRRTLLAVLFFAATPLAGQETPRQTVDRLLRSNEQKLKLNISARVIIVVGQ